MSSLRLSSQCTATSKRTGQRCGQMVLGGGVCKWHGATAAVRANQEARVMRIRAQAYGEVEERTPAERLLAGSRSLDDTLQRLEALAAEQDGADPVLLKEIRAAAESSGRMAKLVQDAGLDERRLQLAEREQADLGAVVVLTLAAFGLEADAAVVRQTVAAAVERVQAGDSSPLPLAQVLELTKGDES